MSDDLQDKPADGVPRGDRPSGELIVDPRLSRAIFDIVEALVVVMDRKGRIRLFNRACERTTGYTGGEMEGRAIWDLLLTPEEAPTVRAVFAVLRAGDFPVEHENDWVAKDGRRRRIAWTNTALLDARGEVQWVIGTGIDVTEQRAAEAALRVSEAQLRALSENLAEGMVYQIDSGPLGLDRRFTYLSPAVERLHGLPHAAAFKDISLLYGQFDGENLARLRVAEDAAVAARKTMNVDVQVRLPSGEERWRRFISIPRTLPGGDLVWDGLEFDIDESKRAEEALRESEAQLRALSENLAEGMVYQIDSGPDGAWRRLVYVSSAVERLHGLTVEEVVRNPALLYDQVIEADRSMLAEREARAFAARSTLNADVQVRLPSGELRWRRFISTPRVLPDGGVVWDGIELEITESKEAEEALRESEAKFKALAETSPSAIFVYRRRFLYVNPAAELLTGYAGEELLGMDYWSIIHPMFGVIIQERARARKRGEAVPSQMEFQIVRKDGEERWLDYGESLIQFGGKPAAVGTALDITARKRAERALRESETKFRLVAETSPTAIFVYRDRFLYANRACEELTGYSPAELEWIDFGDIVHPEHRGLVKQRGAAGLMGTDGTSRQEFKILRKDGGHRWVDFSGTAIGYHGDNAGLGIAVDITRRKELEEELRALSLVDELTGLYNRRGFTTLAEPQIRLARRLRQELLLVFADLDGLKAINDSLGHQVGDQALKEAAEVMRRTFRESDLIARLGGDELVALAVHAPHAPEEELLLRLQGNIDWFNGRGGGAFRLSMSVGTVCVEPGNSQSLEDLLAEADRRMYGRKSVNRRRR